MYIGSVIPDIRPPPSQSDPCYGDFSVGSDKILWASMQIMLEIR